MTQLYQKQIKDTDPEVFSSLENRFPESLELYV